MDRRVGTDGVQKQPLPVGKFSKKFGILAGEYFDYVELLKKETGVAGCPQECPSSKKRFDLNRVKNCDQCPKKRQFDQFKEATIERWEKWQMETSGFDQMLQTFYAVSGLEQMTDKEITLKASGLRAVYREERSKAMDRVAAPLSVATK